MQEITKAIVAVMMAVKGVEKNSTVGRGQSQYKGVADEDVKRAYCTAMAENGLCILPMEIKPTVTPIEVYGKPWTFTQVETKYKLMHTSGESEIISGYGHGLDNADKSAGKATTYALKHALLYTFMTPVGKIDDTDNTHSDDIPTPPKKLPPIPKEAIQQAGESIKAGTVSIVQIESKYSLTEAVKAEILKISKN